MSIQVMQEISRDPVIKVIGVGGCGGNAVDHMISCQIEGVEFVCANTDAQALKLSKATNLIQLGNTLTKGLGAGARPEVGRDAALEDRERIADMIRGANMLFITAGMGGGTGTGAAPVIAQIAKEMGILTVGVVTKPFVLEGGRRINIANSGIEELNKYVDSLIIVPNEKLAQVLGEDVSLQDAFKAANDVLRGAVGGIVEIISKPGLVNVDFADVNTVMAEKGMAMMGSACAAGADRARLAAEEAVASPLLDDVSLTGARGLLINISASASMKIKEVHEVLQTIRDHASEDANIIFGAVFDESLQDNLRVTLVATGINTSAQQQPAAPKKEAAPPPPQPQTQQNPKPLSVVRTGTDSVGIPTGGIPAHTPSVPPAMMGTVGGGLSQPLHHHMAMGQTVPQQPPQHAVQPGMISSDTVDYQQYAQPAVMRRRPTRDPLMSSQPSPIGDNYDPALDVPAFLRKQAD